MSLPTPKIARFFFRSISLWARLLQRPVSPAQAHWDRSQLRPESVEYPAYRVGHRHQFGEHENSLSHGLAGVPLAPPRLSLRYVDDAGLGPMDVAFLVLQAHG